MGSTENCINFIGGQHAEKFDNYWPKPMWRRDYTTYNVEFVAVIEERTWSNISSRGGARGVPGGGHCPPKILPGPPVAPQNFPRDVMPLH